jgi:hypothetical protein
MCNALVSSVVSVGETGLIDVRIGLLLDGAVTYMFKYLNVLGTSFSSDPGNLVMSFCHVALYTKGFRRRQLS